MTEAVPPVLVSKVAKDGSEEVVEGWAAKAAKLGLKPDAIVILLDTCASR